MLLLACCWPLPPGPDLLQALSRQTNQRLSEIDGAYTLPTVTIALGLLAVLILILVNGLFVAIEFALVAVDRARVAMEVEKGNKPWALVSSLLSRLSFHLSGAQLGITISSLLLGFLSEPLAESLLAPIIRPIFGDAAVTTLGVVVAVMVATFLQLVLGELVPKTLAVAEPMRVLRLVARPAHLFGVFAGPIIGFGNRIANWITRKLGAEVVEELHSIKNLEELENVIRSSGKEGKIDPRNVTLLTRSIRFSEKEATDILVPRVELTAIQIDKSATDLAALSHSTGLSRFVVYGEDLDDVQGVVHIKSVHSIPLADRPSTPVGAFMQEAFVVPEGRDLESMLLDMRRTRNQLAVVADEHGGTAGIVTIEDIVEEIVGEIDDEYDAASGAPILKREANAVILDGSSHPDEVEEAIGFVMPEGRYETLAGFALDQLQRIPAAGEVFGWEGWLFEVVEMDKWRIAQLRVRQPAPASAASGESS